MEGARQIGFTVVSISISLIAAFIPLLFMTGVIGRVFREFSVTLTFAIAISMVVSLTLTPMICAHFVRKPPSPDATWFDRAGRAEHGVDGRLYGRSLARGAAAPVARRCWCWWAPSRSPSVLYVKTPKGWFPFDDTGLIWGGTQASPEISFQAMSELQQQATDIVLADPAVAGVGSSIGTSSLQLLGQPRPALHQPQAVFGAPRERVGRDQPPAAEAQRHPRAARVHVPGAGRARGRRARPTRATSTRSGRRTIRS